MKEKIYIALITYNFDSDYVVSACEDKGDAIQQLNTWLADEIHTVIVENGYEPVVTTYSENDKVLIYAADEKAEENPDKAYYRVISTEITPTTKSEKTSEITKVLLAGMMNQNQK